MIICNLFQILTIFVLECLFALLLCPLFSPSGETNN